MTASPTQVGSAAAALAEIERKEQEIQTLMAQLQKEREAQTELKLKERRGILDECKAKLGITSDQELLVIVRNEITPSPRGKRLTKATLDQMKKALAAGASAPEVAKHFDVSLATVHARKAEWKLTHRNLKRVPIRQALKV